MKHSCKLLFIFALIISSAPHNSVAKNDFGEIKLVFVGDIMLGRGVRETVNDVGNGDYRFPFLKTADYLQSADIAFGNLENVISDQGKRTRPQFWCCTFRVDPRAIEGLLFAGFDVLSVANNHIGDLGRIAMKDSFGLLSEFGIPYVGGGFSKEEAHSPVIMIVDDVRIAFLAYNHVLEARRWTATKTQPGAAWLSRRALKRDIANAKEQADIVIVSMHFGIEHIPRSNFIQRMYAHLAINEGASLVIGHHPHVAQEVEVYKGCYIAYSLGNFVFDMPKEINRRGILLEVIIDEHLAMDVTLRHIRINDNWQPEFQ